MVPGPDVTEAHAPLALEKEYGDESAPLLHEVRDLFFIAPDEAPLDVDVIALPCDQREEKGKKKGKGKR